MRLLRVLALPALPVALVAAGCASVDRSGGLQRLAAGDYAGARAFHEALLAAEPGDAALDHDEAGVAALLQGDIQGAHRHFREAFDELEDLGATTAETVGAVVGPADSRRWKGEPYERCMNAYYLGVTYWLLGDEDNAAASFRAGVLRDADSETGAAQSDFALLWFLLGEAQRAALHEDHGAQALARAHQLRPANGWTDPARATTGNVLLLVETGFGPRRVPSGPHGSIVRFQRRAGTTAAVRATSGGRELGDALPLGDIHRQATTRGDKVIDGINAGKAVFKDAAVVGGAIVLDNSGSRTSDALGVALLAAGLLLPAETDLRHFASMPDDVLVLLADLPPGEQVLELQARDSSGAAIPGVTWSVPVTVRPNRVALAWTRVLPSGAAVEAARAAHFVR